MVSSSLSDASLLADSDTISEADSLRGWGAEGDGPATLGTGRPGGGNATCWPIPTANCVCKLAANSGNMDIQPGSRRKMTAVDAALLGHMQRPCAKRKLASDIRILRCVESSPATKDAQLGIVEDLLEVLPKSSGYGKHASDALDEPSLPNVSWITPFSMFISRESARLLRKTWLALGLTKSCMISSATVCTASKATVSKEKSRATICKPAIPNASRVACSAAARAASKAAGKASPTADNSASDSCCEKHPERFVSCTSPWNCTWLARLPTARVSFAAMLTAHGERGGACNSCCALRSPFLTS